MKTNIKKGVKRAVIDMVGFVNKNKNKRITLLIWMYTAIFRFLICFVPMKYLKKYFGKEGEEAKECIQKDEYCFVYLVSHHVNRIAENTPWKSMCLVRALSAKEMLKKRGISSTLYLGIRSENNKMFAHAWLRCGDFYVTGGDGYNYVTVSCYKN